MPFRKPVLDTAEHPADLLARQFTGASRDALGPIHGRRALKIGIALRKGPGLLRKRKLRGRIRRERDGRQKSKSHACKKPLHVSPVGLGEALLRITRGCSLNAFS